MKATNLLIKKECSNQKKTYMNSKKHAFYNAMP